MKATNREDTIAAIATPPGQGAIGIIRLSGPEAIAIVADVFVSNRQRDIRTDSGRIFHGEIRDDTDSLDEVLVHVMRAPHSYTGEDVVEINGHGGAAPLRAILECVLKRGARLAGPGEFTKRAFLNGKMDLVQAEAVVDRIQAGTRAALQAAASAAHGRLSKTIRAMRGTLAEALARVEAAVDFPEEDLPELVDAALRERLEQVHTGMLDLLETAETGRLLREGTAVAIAGRPNVGKSSLFNALLQDARAIVTPYPGTTRDLIEETITISGVPVRLLDTAGLRIADDEVERIGIEVARNALKTAAAILFVVDVSTSAAETDEELSRELRALGLPVLVVLNKVDLAPEAKAPLWTNSFPTPPLRVSAVSGQGLKALEEQLGAILLGEHPVSPDAALLTRVHQRDSVRRAAGALSRMLADFSASPEFLSIDLREALAALGQITGETTSEDVLDLIFGQFCIGK